MRKLYIFFLFCYQYVVAQTGKNEIEILALQGNADAQNQLGMYHASVENITTDDFEKAFYWFSKAANQGLSFAQCNLASCYMNGNGTAKDINKALHWYKKSAEQGFDVAQCKLGVIYYEGHEVPIDYKLAARYFSLATKSDNDNIAGLANGMLSKCYRFGRGVEQDIQKANELLKAAKEKGWDEAKSIEKLIQKIQDIY